MEMSGKIWSLTIWPGFILLLDEHESGVAPGQPEEEQSGSLQSEERNEGERAIRSKTDCSQEQEEQTEEGHAQCNAVLEIS